jgi:AraC-like DNA-binding protein
MWSAASLPEDPLFDPALRALPPAFVVRLPGDPLQWIDMSIRYALAKTTASFPRNPSPPAAELVLIEVLRMHLASAPATDRGWIAALHDPVLAPALARLHAAPERKWTVTALASSVAVSRSVLDERFRSVLGRPPIRYLSEWRMHLADDLLASTDAGIASIAGRVGYESEEAFSRAFKRSRGTSPGAWRHARKAPGRG